MLVKEEEVKFAYMLKVGKNQEIIQVTEKGFEIHKEQILNKKKKEIIIDK